MNTQKHTIDQFEQLIRGLSTLCQEIKLYPEKHPVVEEHLKTLKRVLDKATEQKMNLPVLMINEEFILNNFPLVDLSKKYNYLTTILSKKCISMLRFGKAVPEDEIYKLCVILSHEEKVPGKGESWNQFLTREHIQNIRVFDLKDSENMSPVEMEKYDETLGLVNQLTRLNSDELYSLGLQKLNEIENMILKGESLDIDYFIQMLAPLTPQVLRHKDRILALGTLKSHDEYTFNHVMNVAVIASVLGAALGLPQESLDQICLAAVFHDIGKKKIPHPILNKPGKLNDEEMRFMEQHTHEGAKFLLKSGMFGPIPIIVAFEHHINHDGSGYPVLSRRRPIHPASQIIAIADFYDALRGTRVYRGEMSPEEVYDLMQSLSGRKFDPDILEVFFRTLGIYPPGIIVLIDTGEYGLVVNANPKDIRRPFVKIIKRNDQVIQDDTIYSLAEKVGDQYTRTILSSLAPGKSPEYALIEKMVN